MQPDRGGQDGGQWSAAARWPVDRPVHGQGRSQAVEHGSEFGVVMPLGQIILGCAARTVGADVLADLRRLCRGDGDGLGSLPDHQRA